MGLQLEVVTGLGNSGGGTQLGVKVNLALAYNLSTYPNPFDSELTFDFFLPNEEQIHLSVFDCFGRLILEKKRVSLQRGSVDQTQQFECATRWALLVFLEGRSSTVFRQDF